MPASYSNITYWSPPHQLPPISSESRNLLRLMAVARTLGPLYERVVFVGRAVVNLYSTIPITTSEPRINEDVDCLIKVAPRTAFYQLEDELHSLGFVNDVAAGVIRGWPLT